MRPNFERRLSLLGFFIWLAFVLSASVGAVRAGLIECLFLLAPLVVVPLGFSLRGVLHKDTESIPYLSEFGFLQAVASLSAGASFLVDRGVWASILALPWLVLMGLAGFLGLWRLWERTWDEFPQTCFKVSLLFLPVGAGWFFLSRLGANPMGFSDEIVLLTAVHFHYAGFAASVMAGKLLQGMTGLSPGSNRILLGLCFGIVWGTPLQALGITFMPLLSLFATFLLTVSLWGYAGFLVAFCFLNPVKNGIKFLFGVAAFSITLSMLLACGWGIEAFRQPEVFKDSNAGVDFFFNIPLMAKTHGVLNSIGFCLFGLVGWSRIERASNG